MQGLSKLHIGISEVTLFFFMSTLPQPVGFDSLSRVPYKIELAPIWHQSTYNHFGVELATIEKRDFE